MPRVGNNPNWNRFNLIMKKVIGYSSLPNMAQPEFIAKCYDWIGQFAEIWKKHKDDEEYTSWLIYRGIGNTYSTSSGIDGIDYPHGLLNDGENRKTAARRIRENFENELSEDQISYIVSNVIKYLRSDRKDGFVNSYSRRVSDINVRSMSEYIVFHLVPALEQIEDVYERFSAVLIYAQSGCIPLDVYEAEREKNEKIIAELRDALRKTKKSKDGGVGEIYRSPDYRELNDPMFFGTFYGYFRQYYSKSGEGAFKGLVPFELTIENGENGADAVMTFVKYSPNKKSKTVRMSGKPMIGQQIIHIVLQSDDSEDYITMAFKWLRLRNRRLESREGVLITWDKAERCSQVQQFIFLNQPIAEENEKYVDAFLRFSGDRFVIPDENADGLSPETVGFLKKYGRPLSGYTVCSNRMITEAQYDGVDDREIVKRLLEIKARSMSPLVFNAKVDKQISDFFRSMLYREEKAVSGTEQ